jgi:hypothetical protein
VHLYADVTVYNGENEDVYVGGLKVEFRVKGYTAFLDPPTGSVWSDYVIPPKHDALLMFEGVIDPETVMGIDLSPGAYQVALLLESAIDWWNFEYYDTQIYIP